MWAWTAAAAFVGIVSAVLAFSSMLPAAHNIALLVTCAAIFVLLAAFEAHEAQGPRPSEGED